MKVFLLPKMKMLKYIHYKNVSTITLSEILYYERVDFHFTKRKKWLKAFLFVCLLVLKLQSVEKWNIQSDRRKENKRERRRKRRKNWRRGRKENRGEGEWGMKRRVRKRKHKKLKKGTMLTVYSPYEEAQEQLVKENIYYTFPNVF